MNEGKLGNIVKEEYGKIRATQTEKERIRKKIEKGLEKNTIKMEQTNITEVKEMKGDNRGKHAVVKRNGLMTAAVVVLCVGIGGAYAITNLKNNAVQTSPSPASSVSSSDENNYNQSYRPSIEGKVVEVTGNSTVKVQIASTTLTDEKRKNYLNGNVVTVDYKKCGYTKYDENFSYDEPEKSYEPQVNDIVSIGFWPTDEKETVKAESMDFYRNKKSLTLSDGTEIKYDGEKISAAKNGKVVSEMKVDNIYSELTENYNDAGRSDCFWIFEYSDGSIYDMEDNALHDGIVCKKYNGKLELEETFYMEKHDDQEVIESFAYNEKTDKFYAACYTKMSKENFSENMKLYEYSPENKNGICLKTIKAEKMIDNFTNYFSKSGDTFFYTESIDDNGTFNVKAIALDEENKCKELDADKDAQKQKMADGFSTYGGLIYDFGNNEIVTYVRENNVIKKRSLKCIDDIGEYREGEVGEVSFNKAEKVGYDDNDYYTLDYSYNDDGKRKGMVFSVNRKTGELNSYIVLGYNKNGRIKAVANVDENKIKAYVENSDNKLTDENTVKIK